MVNLKGVLVAVSHVFYLSGQPKCFFLQIQVENRDKPVFVLILLEKDLSADFKKIQVHPELFWSKLIDLRNLKSSTLSMSHGQIKMLLVEPNSTISISEEMKVTSNLFEDCVSYEGIVTNDLCIDAGVFVVDNRVTVVMSTLCVITNIRAVQSGSKVVIRNGHMRRLPNGKLALLLCAKGRVDTRNHDDESMHSKRDHRNFEANHTIQKCLHLSLSSKQLLKIFQALTDLEKTVRIFKENCMKAKLLCKSSAHFEDATHNFFDFKIEQVPHRSLLNEFLSNPHECSIDVPDGSENWPCMSNLDTVRKLISDELDSRKECQDTATEEFGRKDSPCSFKYYTLDSNEIKDLPLVIGHLQINSESGQYEICDNTGKIEVIFEKVLPNPGYMIRAKKFVACQEISSVGRYVWKYFYLVVTEFQLLQMAEDLPGSTNEGCETWAVKLVSHPLRMGTAEMSVLIAAKSLQKNEEKFLRVPAKAGLDYLPGCQMSLRKSHKEKFSPLLNNFLKANCMKSEPTVIDVEDFAIVSKGLYTPNDAYDVADIDLLPGGELISVEGVIVEKWLELSKYTTGCRTNEDSLLSHVDIEIKLTSSDRLKNHSTVSLYVTKWDMKANLLGLFRGVHVKFNCVVKAISKKSNVYLMTTLFSSMRVLKVSSHVNPSHGEIFSQPVDFVSFIPPESSKAFHCFFTVETVIKMSITATCGACGQMVKHGSCSFVGCHAGNKVETNFDVKATLKVEDGTNAALLFCDKADLLKKMLSINTEEWSELESEAKKLGELVHLTNSGLSNNRVFSIFCQWFPSEVLCQFHCICRVLRSSRESFDDTLKLYCIEVS